MKSRMILYYLNISMDVETFARHFNGMASQFPNVVHNMQRPNILFCALINRFVSLLKCSSNKQESLCSNWAWRRVSITKWIREMKIWRVLFGTLDSAFILGIFHRYIFIDYRTSNFEPNIKNNIWISNICFISPASLIPTYLRGAIIGWRRYHSISIICLHCIGPKGLR